jgi:hypothetical protein
MARPPAEVRFPGDKNRRKKVKVRGIKQASKQIQQRLERGFRCSFGRSQDILARDKSGTW